MELKQTETGQNGDLQATGQITAKQKLVSYPKLLFLVPPKSKLADSLFRETTKTNLFVLDSVKLVSDLVLILSICTEFCRTSYSLEMGVSDLLLLQLFRLQSCKIQIS
jgi:hypothetical protein